MCDAICVRAQNRSQSVLLRAYLYYYYEIRSKIIDSIFERTAQNNKESRGKKYAHEKNRNRFEKSHFNYTIQFQLAKILIVLTHLSLLLLRTVHWGLMIFVVIVLLCGLILVVRVCVSIFSLSFDSLKTDANLLRCQICISCSQCIKCCYAHTNWLFFKFHLWSNSVSLCLPQSLSV